MSRINIQSSRGTIDLRPVMGRMGPQGEQGVQGIQGIPGNDGAAGGEGATGPQGLPGVNAVANDTATAGYISTAGTSATKTALEAAFATRRLGLAGSPAPLSSATAGTTPEPVDVFDGYVWGYRAGDIYRSADNGDTWSVYCPAPGADVVLRLIKCSDGEVVAARGTTIYKSSGWAGGSPTWTTKITANGQARFQAFQVDGDGTKFIAAQYGPGAGPGSQPYIDSRYAHISTDSGATWTQVWDSVAKFGATEANASHLHGACYDPWSDRFYIAEGHGATFELIGGVYVSDDDGATWTRPAGLVNQPPPTVMVPTDDGIVCGSDHALAGMWGIVRQANIADEKLTRTWAWTSGEDGVIGFGVRGFRDPRTGVVYSGFYTAKTTVAPIIAGGTAAAAGRVWAWPTLPVVLADQIDRLVISNGRLIARASMGGTNYTIKGELPGPRGGQTLDTGNTLGGTADGSSMASGARAATKIGGLHNTALGVDAAVTGTQDATAGGWAAQAKASAATSYGANAKADGQSTSLGQNSDSAGFGNSVALGYNAVNTSAAQVQLGGRHAEMIEVSEPVAPGTDRARIFAKDNGSGATQLMVKFNTGAAQALATQGSGSGSAVNPLKAEALLSLSDVVAYDTFDRANASSLGTSDSGHAWTGPDWAIVANRARGSASVLSGFAYLNAGVGSGTVSARIRRGPSRSTGLAFRVTGVDDGLMVISNVGGTNVSLYKRVGGTNTLLGSAATYDWLDTLAQDLRVIYRNDRIKVFADDTLILSHTLSGGDYSAFPTTAHGAGMYVSVGDLNTAFDNFVVKSAV